MIKHSVIMVTYNQENLIRDALESIFTQDILPYEVIIGDDCSTDNTRSVIAEYQNKYLSIIKPIFNEENMGIYRNLNNIKEYGVSGDIVSFLSGDDLFKNHMFSAFNKIIEENNLDPKKDKFMILSNVINLSPNGNIHILNNFEKRDKNSFKLKLRKSIGSRYTGISRKVFDDLPLFDTTIGLWADYLHGIDLFNESDKNYFIDEAFPVYRTGIGIATKSQQKNLLKSYILTIEKIKSNYQYQFDFFDHIYLQDDILRSKAQLSRNSIDILRYLIYHPVVLLDGFRIYKWVIDVAGFLPNSLIPWGFIPRRLRR